jgi:hypothetical protein
VTRHDDGGRRRGGTGRGKGGDEASWVDVNFTGSKNKEKIYTVDLADINGR